MIYIILFSLTHNNLAETRVQNGVTIKQKKNPKAATRLRLRRDPNETTTTTTTSTETNDNTRTEEEEEENENEEKGKFLLFTRAITNHHTPTISQGKTKKIGTKKLAKLQMKEEKAKMREAEEQRRESLKKAEEKRSEEQKEKDKQREEEERKQACHFLDPLKFCRLLSLIISLFSLFCYFFSFHSFVYSSVLIQFISFTQPFDSFIYLFIQY